jgi:hypothetical protein
MRDVITLAMAFERPTNFDLAEHWKSTLATLKRQQQYVTATLALSPEAVLSLNRWCPMVSVADHLAKLSLPESWVVFDVEFESYHQARFVVLGLGSRAIALAPDALCGEVKAEILRMLDPVRLGYIKP